MDDAPQIWTLSTEASYQHRHFDFANMLLHETIKRCNSQCRCSPDLAHCRAGRLQLTECVQPAAGEGNDLIYDTVFPGGDSVTGEQSEQALLRLRFQVPSREQISKKVRWTEPSVKIKTSGNPSSLPLLQQEQGRPTDLCTQLKEDIGAASICLRATVGQLYDVEHTDPEESELSQQEGHNIITAVTSYRLSDTGKLFLACSIAFSVWQYYGSPWMAHRWTVDNIHFLQEKHYDSASGKQVHDFRALKPFVKMRLGEGDTITKSDAEYDRSKTIHHAPRLLGLGVILVAIFWGPLPGWTAAQTESFSETKKYNNERLRCFHLLEREPELDLQTEFPLKQTIQTAVKACLDEKSVNKLKTPENRREYLYQQTVGPLLCLAGAMRKANFKPEAERWQPLPVHIDSASVTVPTTIPIGRPHRQPQGSLSTINGRQVDLYTENRDETDDCPAMRHRWIGYKIY